MHPTTREQPTSTLAVDADARVIAARTRYLQRLSCCVLGTCSAGEVADAHRRMTETVAAVVAGLPGRS